MTTATPTTPATPPAALVDLLPDGVLQLDADRVIVAANAATVRLTGRPVEALLGRPCHDVVEARGRDGEPACAAGWHASSRLRSVRAIPEQEVTVRRADGTDLRTLASGTYQRDPSGRLLGAVLVLRDASRRAHRAATGIEIVSVVSHELRSPLTSVKGYTSLLLNRWDRLADDQKRMMLEQVHHDADRVTRLITELLDISRLETGRLVLRRQMIDLAKLAAAVVDKVRLEYPDLEADVDFPAAMPEVYADPDKVEQVLTNLVENACKYASPKGIALTGTVNPDAVSVTVTDRGEGIPLADLPNVFTKWFRRSEGRPTGSGLGLWISRGLVEAHHGRLVAESIPGRGTSFRFTLPLIDLEDLHRP